MDDINLSTVCSVCQTNALHKKNKIQNNLLMCNSCYMILPLEMFKKKNKRCVDCVRASNRVWQQENSYKWRKGGCYYNYKKKNETLDSGFNNDEAQIAMLGSLN